MRVPLVARGFRSRSLKLSPELLVNAHPETHPGKLSNISVTGKPGKQLFADLGNSPVRMMHEVGGVGYALAGDRFYIINSDGTFEQKGIVPGTTRPKVDDNGSEIVMPVGDGYVYNIASEKVEQITDVDYHQSTSCAFVGQYISFIRDGTGEFFLSAFNDATDLDALDFATSESVPDNNIANHQFQGNHWVFGLKSVEIWYVSGESFPLNPYDNGSFNVGCGARLSIASNDKYIIWLSHDRRVFLSSGGQPLPISSPEVDFALSQLSSVDDGEGFIYHEDGHIFYQLSFSAANRTLVYDFREDFWHERKTINDRDRASMHMYAYGKHLVGDYQSGKIYDVSLDYADENGEKMIKEGIIPPLQTDEGEITLSNFELVAQTGITPLNEPEAMLQLRWSENGEDWGNWTEHPLGAQGKRRTKIQIDGLPSEEQLYFHWRTNVRAPFTLIKARANV